MAALNNFLLVSGLFPRGDLPKSLLEIVTGLRYLTASDAELASVSQQQRGPAVGGKAASGLEWAAQLRAKHAAMCTKCDERAPTSTLFPLEDLLVDLTWELQEQLLEAAARADGA